MKKTLSVMALLGLSLSASAMTIDSFNGDLANGSINQVSAPSGGGCSVSNASGSTSAAIGGHRSLTASNLGGVGCATANVNFNFADAYSADLPTSTPGIFSVIWNANGAGLSTYMGSNLSLAGFTFAAFQDVNGAADVVSFKVCTSADGSAGCTTSTAATITNLGVTAADFQSYTVSLNGLVTGIQYISMNVTAPAGRDLTIDYVNGEVPEPATFAMAGLALAGIGYMRRRRS